MSRRRVFWVSCVIGVCVLPVVASAATPDSSQSPAPPSGAPEIVLQALQSEADGDLVARDRLLTLAAESDGDCAPAQWHRGWFKNDQGQWRSVETYATGDHIDAALARYEARRSASPDAAQGQYELALWCMENGFREQGRAHAQRTLELAPDHLGARNLLGFRNMGGQWISPEQQTELSQRAQRVAAGLNKYGKQLIELRRALNLRSAKARDTARRALMEIRDPAAVGPIEAILGTAKPEAVQAALACLSAIADPEASMSLARFAMFHPDAAVARSATDYLKSRPLHDYVPSLVQMLSSPVVSMAVPVLAPDGTLTGFRQSFTQEHLGQTEVLVLDTQLNYSSGEAQTRRTRRPRSTLAPVDALSQIEAAERSLERATENQVQMQASNALILARNSQLCRFLSEVAEREFAQPADVWKWWDETNETEYQALKPSSVRYASSTLTTRNYNDMAARAAMALSSGSNVVGECFARGTPVITRKGPQAIETVRVGDLVLSRDISTGELSWKAVLRTTTRPPRTVFEISLDNEKLCCTGGHLFWVSGKGWTKASQLRPGDVLHGAAQPVIVMKVAEQPEQTTFNLAVDQTQTYFVGRQMVLSHDVTDRVPTHLKVPGLVAVNR